MRQILCTHRARISENELGSCEGNQWEEAVMAGLSQHPFS